MAGIVGYGVYIPSYRIKVEEIAKVWGDNAQAVSRGLVVNEKSVPAPDEDTATISVEAARNSIKRANIDPKKIGAVYVGSESHPYAVKPTATIVAEAVDASPDLTAADLEFACKAGTAGIQICMGLVDSGNIEYGLAIGADTAQGAPGDALEYTASAGGAAYLIGSENTLADFEGTYSFTTDTPDFYRRKENLILAMEDDSQVNLLTSNMSSQQLKECLKMGTEASDYDHAVFHQPNGKFYIRAARKLGFNEEQYKTGLLTPTIGNTYSGATPLGLAAILDVAKPGDRIFAVSYGSGAGSDAFSIEVKEGIKEKHGLSPTVHEIFKNKR